MPPLYPPNQGSQANAGYIPWTPHQFPNPTFVEEFDEGSISAMEAAGGWRKFGFAAVNASDVDDYAAFGAGDPRCNINAQRPSWLRIQPAANDTYVGWTRPIVPLTNCGVVMRGIINHRVLSVANNDGVFALMAYADDGAGNPDPANRLEMYIGETDASTLTAQSSRVVAGVATVIAEGGNEQSSGMDITWVGMQKIGAAWHFWCMADSNNSMYFGSFSPAFAIAHMGVIAKNTQTTAPGNMVLGVDWYREYNGILVPW